VGSLFGDLEITDGKQQQPNEDLIGASGFSFIDSNSGQSTPSFATPVAPTVTTPVTTPATKPVAQQPVAVLTPVLVPISTPTHTPTATPTTPSTTAATNQLMGLNFNPTPDLSAHYAAAALAQQQQLMAMGVIPGYYPITGQGVGIAGLSGTSLSGTALSGTGLAGHFVATPPMANISATSGGFDFVENTGGKPEDPFSFIKIGQ